MKGLIVLMAAALPASAGDLRSAVDAALARSPQVAEARARRRQADAAGREATLTRLPRLSARAEAMRSDDPLFSFGQLLQERRVTAADFNPDTLNRPGYRSSVRGALELGLPVFTGFELSRARRLAELAGTEAEAMAGAAGQAVALRAVELYLAGLKGKELAAELDARLASARAELDRSERLAKSGLVLGSDHQAALALYSSLKAWRARAGAESAARAAALSVVTGASAETAGALGAWEPPLEDDAALEAEALAARPELSAAAARREAAGVRRASAEQSLLPRVEAFASATSVSGDFSSGAGARLAGLRASVAFGDPAWGARRSRAKEDEAAAEAARAGAADAARAEVLARAAGLRGLSAALVSLDEALARASEALEQVRPLYRSGRQSVLEVLRAEEARARLVEARLDARARQRSEWAALKAAQGRLDAAAVEVLTRSLEAPR